MIFGLFIFLKYSKNVNCIDCGKWLFKKIIIESYANYIIHLIISVYNEKYVAG